MTLTKENKFIKRPSAVKNSSFTISDDNTDDLSISNGLLTIDHLNNFLRKFFKKKKKNALVNIVSQNATLLQTSLDKFTMEINDNNNRLNNIMKKTDDVKLSVETCKNITEFKLKHT